MKKLNNRWRCLCVNIYGINFSIIGLVYFTSNITYPVSDIEVLGLLFVVFFRIAIGVAVGYFVGIVFDLKEALEE